MRGTLTMLKNYLFIPQYVKEEISAVKAPQHGWVVIFFFW